MADKYRVFSGVIYPDSESYNPVQVIETLKSKFKEWAYCLHDSDVNDDGELKKPHIHWVGRGDPRTLSAVAKFLGLKENEVELGKNFKALIQYLIHLNNPEKAQYSMTDVVTNISDIEKYLRNLSEGQLVEDLAEAKMSMNWRNLVKYANENGCYDVFRRNLGVLKLIWAESNGDLYKAFSHLDLF